MLATVMAEPEEVVLFAPVFGSGRRRHCIAACGGVEVPCLLTFYHRDTRVLEKAKELVARKFVLV